MSVREIQLGKLRRVLEAIEGSGKSAEAGVSGSFYRGILNRCGVSSGGLGSLDDFVANVPFTSKEDLVRDHAAHPPFGSNLTYPISNYTRFCQTSGTSSGAPMAWVDTPESWESMLECWRKVYRAAGVVAGVDRIFFAFSFGPFLGFWTAFEAAGENMVIPGGGLSSAARIAVMARYGATALCCTPTYALRLGEVLKSGEAGFGTDDLSVRKVIVAGEPGGSLPATRARISELWGGADVFDHHGMTEVGPVSFEHPEARGNLAVIESAYFGEILDRETGREVSEGEEGELVLTTLDRVACPLLRYRTGDLVRKRTVGGVLTLEGGVLGRCDDMVVVRGVNLYPSAIEGVVREVGEVVEFQVVEREEGAMREIELEVEVIEGGDGVEVVLENLLRDRFSMRIPVRVVGAGELPRYEFKAKRWVKK